MWNRIARIIAGMDGWMDGEATHANRHVGHACQLPDVYVPYVPWSSKKMMIEAGSKPD